MNTSDRATKLVRDWILDPGSTSNSIAIAAIDKAFRATNNRIANNSEIKSIFMHELYTILQADFEENAPAFTGVYSDLISAALKSVDWFSIRETVIEQVMESPDIESGYINWLLDKTT